MLQFECVDGVTDAFVYSNNISEAASKSDVNIRNNIDPRTVPRGTPDLTGEVVEAFPLTKTDYFILVRNEHSTFTLVPML